VAYNRDIVTGRRRTLSAELFVSLNYCGGTSDTNPVDGWRGSSYYHPTDFSASKFHQLNFGTNFDPGFYIKTRQAGSNPYNPTSGLAWVTGIYKTDGTTLIEWANDADPTWDRDNPTLIPPSETITARLNCTLEIEEVAREYWFGSIRPSSATEIQRAYFYRPVGNVSRTLVYYGGTYNDSIPASGLSNHLIRDGFLSEYKYGFPDIFFSQDESDLGTAFGGYAYVTYNEPTDTDYEDVIGRKVRVQDLPYPYAKVADAAIFMNAPLHYFGWNGKDEPVGLSLVHAFGEPSAPYVLQYPYFAFPSLPSWDSANLYIAHAGNSNPVEVPGHGFVPPAYAQVHAWQGYNATMGGAFYNWEQSALSVPISPLGDSFSPNGFDPPVHNTDPISRRYPYKVGADSPAEYTPSDTEGAIYETGDEEYDAIRITHTQEIILDSFTGSYFTRT
jgi:hypothetical protein